MPLAYGISLGTASVFCVSLDPKTNTLAVTGGEDDKAFVWRLSDGELLFECAGEGHELAHGMMYLPEPYCWQRRMTNMALWILCSWSYHVMPVYLL